MIDYKTAALWAQCGCECPSSRMAAVQELNGFRVRRKRRVVYPNISRHADELGCRREHLWMVLTGRRKSRRLLARYQELVG